MGRIRRSGRWFGAFTTLCAFLYAPNRWARKHHIRWTPALERRRQFVVGWLYLRAGALTVNAEGRPIAGVKLKRIYTRPSPWLRGRLDKDDQRDRRGLGDLVPTVLGKTREIIDTDDRQVTAHPLDAPLARLDATLARPDDAPAVQNALDAIEQDIVGPHPGLADLSALCSSVPGAAKDSSLPAVPPPVLTPGSPVAPHPCAPDSRRALSVYTLSAEDIHANRASARGLADHHGRR